MASTLVGLFDDRDAAQGAVNDLISAGFSRDKISIVASDSTGKTVTTDAEGNLAAEGAASGISSGAVVGGVAGLLIGAGFTVLPIAGFLVRPVPSRASSPVRRRERRRAVCSVA